MCDGTAAERDEVRIQLREEDLAHLTALIGSGMAHDAESAISYALRALYCLHRERVAVLGDEQWGEVIL